VRKPAGNCGVRTKGRSVDVMSVIKKNIVTVKAALNCLAYALIIGMACVNGDPMYQLYRDCKGLTNPVEILLKASGVDLSNGGGFEEIRQLQNHLSDYQIIVFHGLNPDRVMSSENSRSAKKLHLLHDRDNENYNVITNLQSARAKKFICNGCDTLYDFTHKCDIVCSLCTATPSCTKDQTKDCSTCNRQFLSEKCFQNHLTLNVKGKLFCQWRKVCRHFSYLVTGDSKHECFKKFCNICNKKQPSGHFCYLAPLKPSKLSDIFLYVFFDTECTQDLEKRDGSFEHVPNLICAQQMFSKCEAVDDLIVDYEQCGKRVHVFW